MSRFPKDTLWWNTWYAQRLQGRPLGNSALRKAYPLRSPSTTRPAHQKADIDPTRRRRLNPKTLFFIVLTITSVLVVIHESSAISPSQPQATSTSFGVAAGFGSLAANTIARQSLLRLANTTGLSFFIANGDLAKGYYYGHEADWCSEFHAHYPNLIINAGTFDTGHDFTSDYEIYDANNNGIYDTGDTIIFKGSGTPPVLGSTSLNPQVHTEYVDTGGIGHWVPGDPVLFDEHGVGIVQSQMPLLSGPMPAPGTKLSLDPLLTFYDSTGDGFNTPPTGNRNFEAFAAAPACNTPPPAIVGGYHYSGINCSPFLPGQPGYSFPTCYGREFYFDCCQPTAQMRIILISPGIQNITGLGSGYNINTWNFQARDAHYNWLNSTIQDAATKALLTMVISADVCPSLGAEECGEGFHTVSPIDSVHHQFGMDLVDLLAAGKVDFWIGGSDYGYARQKQMTSINCPFTATSYLYDGSSIYANKDICNHITTSLGNVNIRGSGYVGVVSAAFGSIIRHFNESGEPIVQDLNSNNIYDLGERFIASPPPPIGSPLTGPISNAPNNLIFNDVNSNGIWDPVNDTLYFDANGNGQWDPGETILEGPYNVWQLPQHPVSATQFKIVDWNSNGIWDQTLNGSLTGPHHALLAQGPNGYYSTFMGKNTPCNTTTCYGHGWLEFTLDPVTITASTHFCRDDENPTSNFSSCVTPAIYNDHFVLILGGGSVGTWGRTTPFKLSPLS